MVLASCRFSQDNDKKASVKCHWLMVTVFFFFFLFFIALPRVDFKKKHYKGFKNPIYSLSSKIATGGLIQLFCEYPPVYFFFFLKKIEVS